MMENKEVNIVFILDDEFVIPTVVAITSLTENKNPDTLYNIYLITNNLSDENISLFNGLKFKNVNITMKNLKENFDTFKISRNGFHVSSSAIIKFSLPNILNDIDKLLYLDGDIIVQKDLLDLFNTEISDNYAAVVEDIRTKYRYIKTQLEELKIPHHRGYFNSGMMLLNLKKMRNNNISEKLFSYREQGFNVFMDQDAFNVVFNDEVVFLHPMNNFLTTLKNDFDIVELNKHYKLNDKYKNLDEIAHDSKILHFSSKYKPWLYSNTWLEDVWNYYFNKSCAKNLITSKKIKFENSSLKADNLIISLTSYPARIEKVEQAIKSLLNQTLQPKKIVLALGEDKFPNKEEDLPENLKCLLSNKFEILWTPKDLRSYTKLIPALKKYPDSIIVTVDDDILYKKDLLAKLYNSYKQNPNLIHCHRVHKISFNNKKQINPYRKWMWGVRGVKPSFNNFLTGVGGVLYPPNCLYKDILREDLFMKLCPQADDIWFWAMAVLNNTKINVIENCETSLNYIDGTQEIGLWHSNVAENQNDIQLQNVMKYYPKIIKKLDKDNGFYNNKLEKIFSLKNEPIKNQHKIITVLGLKLKINKEFLKRFFWLGNKKSKNNKYYKVICILGIKLSLRNKRKEIKMEQENFKKQVAAFFINLEKQQENIAKQIENIARQYNVIQKQMRALQKNQDIYKKTYNSSLVFDNKFPIINSLIYVPDYPLDYIQRTIVETGTFYEISDLNYLNNYLNHNSVVLDIGANIGNHTVYWAKRSCVKKVYSFEPIKSTYEKLQKNIEINGLNNIVIPFNKGVGDTVSKSSILSYNSANCGGSTITVDLNGDIDIITIDSINITEDNIDLIKIDTEGFEYKVLLGAIETIKKYKPAIYIEIGDCNFEKVINLLSELGYQQKEQVKKTNYLFVHKERQKQTELISCVNYA